MRSFIELPSTKLAGNSVIILFHLLLDWLRSKASTRLVAFASSHCLSEHFTLSFPLAHLASRFDWLLLRFFLRNLRLPSFRLRVYVLVSVFVWDFSMLLAVKLLPFLDKNFLTDSYMFRHCFGIEFSSTRRALLSVFFLIMLIIGCLLINALLLLLLGRLHFIESILIEVLRWLINQLLIMLRLVILFVRLLTGSFHWMSLLLPVRRVFKFMVHLNIELL